jgi:hypothetical protein
VKETSSQAPKDYLQQDKCQGAPTFRMEDRLEQILSHIHLKKQKCFFSYGQVLGEDYHSSKTTYVSWCITRLYHKYGNNIRYLPDCSLVTANKILE